MPRFHFNTHKGDQVLADLEGEMLLDIDAARIEAMASAREVLANAIKSSVEPPDFIRVVNSDGQAVLTITLSDLITKSMKK